MECLILWPTETQALHTHKLEQLLFVTRCLIYIILQANAKTHQKVVHSKRVGDHGPHRSPCCRPPASSLTWLPAHISSSFCLLPGIGFHGNDVQLRQCAHTQVSVGCALHQSSVSQRFELVRHKFNFELRLRKGYQCILTFLFLCVCVCVYIKVMSLSQYDVTFQMAYEANL